MKSELKDQLRRVADSDVEALLVAEQSYGDSWKRRGGVGAFMMLARKWDRLEQALDPARALGDPREAPISARIGAPVPAWDVLAAATLDPRPEGVIDDIRDLRRYLLLVEAELVRRGVTHGALRKDAPTGGA